MSDILFLNNHKSVWYYNNSLLLTGVSYSISFYKFSYNVLEKRLFNKCAPKEWIGIVDAQEVNFIS